MLDAVRTVSETDEVRTIEGRLAYGGPFAGGRDIYQTIFSARTDYGLDLHPAGLPVLFDHGFDPEMGLHPIGRTGPTSAFRRMDDGLWIQMQIDKRDEYYSRIGPLLDAGKLGVSQGSAEHSVDIDARTGQVLTWPLHEVSLTPTEANPDSLIAARTAATLRIIEGFRGWLPAGVTEGDLDDGDFAWVSSDGKTRKLPYKVHGKVNEAGWKAAWSRAHQDGTDFTGGPDQAAVIRKLLADKPADVTSKYDGPSGEAVPGGRSAVRSAAPMAADILSDLLALRDCEADEPDQAAVIDKAVAALLEYIPMETAEPVDDEAAPPMLAMYSVRAGRRNSAADQVRIDAIHDHSVALGASSHPGAPRSEDDANEADASDGPPDDGDAADRSAESRPGRLRIVAARPETPDVDPAVRAALAAHATAEARRLLGR